MRTRTRCGLNVELLVSYRRTPVAKCYRAIGAEAEKDVNLSGSKADLGLFLLKRSTCLIQTQRCLI